MRARTFFASALTAGPRSSYLYALVQDLPDQSTQPVSDGTDRLRMLAVNLRKKVRQPVDAKATRDIVADYLTWQVIVNGGEAILDALDLEKRYQISFWDALIVQAAQSSGAEVLYSEDLADGERYGSIHVLNPFVDRWYHIPTPRLEPALNNL